MSGLTSSAQAGILRLVKFPAKGSDSRECRRLGISPTYLRQFKRLLTNTRAHYLGVLFPVVRAGFETEAWDRLVARYYAAHAMESLESPKTLRSFVRFLNAHLSKAQRTGLAQDVCEGRHTVVLGAVLLKEVGVRLLSPEAWIRESAEGRFLYFRQESIEVFELDNDFYRILVRTPKGKVRTAIEQKLAECA